VWLNRYANPRPLGRIDAQKVGPESVVTNTHVTKARTVDSIDDRANAIGGRLRLSVRPTDRGSAAAAPRGFEYQSGGRGASTTARRPPAV
jgi:hypothetical protein